MATARLKYSDAPSKPRKPRMTRGKLVLEWTTRMLGGKPTKRLENKYNKRYVKKTKSRRGKRRH